MVFAHNDVCQPIYNIRQQMMIFITDSLRSIIKVHYGMVGGMFDCTIPNKVQYTHQPWSESTIKGLPRLQQPTKRGPPNIFRESLNCKVQIHTNALEYIIFNSTSSHRKWVLGKTKKSHSKAFFKWEKLITEINLGLVEHLSKKNFH